MEYNMKTLLENIDSYYSGTISKTALGEWAAAAYYDLLKGGYIEKDKLVIYPFVKLISTFHREPNDRDDFYPCPEENVRIIQTILHGERDFRFSVELSIAPPAHPVISNRSCFDLERWQAFSTLRDMLPPSFAPGHEFSEDLSANIESVLRLPPRDNLILDMLEEQILRLLKFLLPDQAHELALPNTLRLYAQKPTQNILAERLITYLDCYIGNRNFQALVAYEAGESNLSLVV